MPFRNVLNILEPRGNIFITPFHPYLINFNPLTAIPSATECSQITAGENSSLQMFWIIIYTPHPLVPDK